jgi:hypothetical protein
MLLDGLGPFEELGSYAVSPFQFPDWTRVSDDLVGDLQSTLGVVEDASRRTDDRQEQSRDDGDYRNPGDETGVPAKEKLLFGHRALGLRLSRND